MVDCSLLAEIVMVGPDCMGSVSDWVASVSPVNYDWRTMSCLMEVTAQAVVTEEVAAREIALSH